jgi:hypothetical protein
MADSAGLSQINAEIVRLLSTLAGLVLRFSQMRTIPEEIE